MKPDRLTANHPHDILIFMDMELYQARLMDLIEYALLTEVHAAPKPGLVDRLNNGSHPDMDEALFQRSARALKPWFGQFMTLALAAPDDLVLPRLRRSGMDAERVMFAATGGVNTHKGAIFSLGLIVACLTRLAHRLDRAPGKPDIPELIELIRYNTAGLTGELPEAPASHGRDAWQHHGIQGIRREAEAGYPAVFAVGLPALARYRRLRQDPDLPLLLTLLELILVTDDTTLLRRGGPQGLTFMRTQARAILQTAAELSDGVVLGQFCELDREATRRHLSPGGAADNLAMTIFLEQALTPADLL